MIQRTASLLSIAEWKATTPAPGAGAPSVVLRDAAAASGARMDDGGAVAYVMSTETVDRPGDTIRAAGWELEAFRSNPVLLFGHDMSAPPVGKVGKVAVEGARLIGRSVEFTPADVYEFGATIGRMVHGGFLPACSVGFQPLDWKFNEQRGGVDFLRQSLLELSVVPVPANPEALVGAKSAGISLAPYREWVEKALDGGVSTLVVPRSALEAARAQLAPRLHVSAGVPAAEKSVEAQPEAAAPAPDALAEMRAHMAELSKGMDALRAELAALKAPAPAPAAPAPAPAAKAAAPALPHDFQARVARAVENRLRAAFGRVD